PSPCSTRSSSASARPAPPWPSTCPPASRSRSALCSSPRRSHPVPSPGCWPLSPGRCWQPSVPNRRPHRRRLRRDRLVEVLLYRGEQRVGNPRGKLRPGTPCDLVQLVLIDNRGDSVEQLAGDVGHLSSGGGMNTFTEQPSRLDGDADLFARFAHGGRVERLPGFEFTGGELPGQVTLADPSPHHQHAAVVDDDRRDDGGP